MGLFALFSRRLSGCFFARLPRATRRRFSPPPLAPQRLERRRVLDAGAAGLLLGSLAESGDYVQAGVPSGDALPAQASESVGQADLAPLSVELYLGASEVFENEVLQLGVAFEDPNNSDTHWVTIDWGDGTPLETFTIDRGDHFLGTSHRYVDDNPSAAPIDTNTIEVTVFDSLGNEAAVTAAVTVKNIAPTIDTLSITTPSDEFQFATLTGTYSDPGTQDTFELDIDWDGDHVFDQTVTVAGGAFEVFRQYLDDDPTGSSSDTFNVHVQLRDDDTGTDVDSVPLTVNNVAPTKPLLFRFDSPLDEAGVAQVLLSFQDPGILDSHRIEIDWGDGTTGETIDVPSGGQRFFLLSHVYADDNPTATLSDSNLMRVTVTDDDGGQSMAELAILVKNVSPILTVATDQIIDEGALLDLTGGGLGAFTDVGLLDTHTATVNWGDGTASETVAVNQGYGSGSLDASHRYADNGVYTVTVAVADDDGGLVSRAFQIQVHNVAPTLVLTDRALEISESETLDLFDLGTFSDPGFDNSLNVGDPTNGGEVTETFSYTIDWGDGTVETGQLPAGVVSGTVGVDTLGTLLNSHPYLDNDLDSIADNLYTITVTLSDDDGGSVTRQLTVRVLNINPTLEPVAATNLNTRGETTLTLEFADPGTEMLTVWVDWGDQLALPPDQRFVPESLARGPGTQNQTLRHTYSGPPNPLSPASDILISVFVRDDDFGEPLVVDVGQSETLAVAISNPGTGVNPVVIDTTPQVPRLIFPQQEEIAFLAGASSADEGGLQTTDLRTAVGDTKSTTDRFLELRVIDPASGEPSEGYRLQPEVLNDLPGLFRTLPDNRYAIYLVRTETNTRRLVIEVYVRNGKLIDPGDDSEGTRDRPPTDEATPEATLPPSREVQPDETPIFKPAQPKAPDETPDETPLGVPAETSAITPPTIPVTTTVGPAAGVAWLKTEQIETHHSEVVPSNGHPSTRLLGLAVVGLAASESARSWVERINQAVATADRQQWDRLRRSQSRNRK